MTRSWVERALAAVMAVWFVLVTIEPAALHSCPMHGAHAPAHAGATATAPAHHAAHAPASDASSPGAPAAAQHCTCLGDCAGVSLAVLPVATHTPWPAAVAAVSALPPLEAGFIPPAADFALPFANGPPPVQG